MKFLMMVLAAAVLLAAPAHAVSIKNLSGSTQVVVVEQGGETRNITLTPNQTIRIHGADVTLAMPGQRPKQTDFYEDYTIWGDGKLVIQRINKIKGGAR